MIKCLPYKEQMIKNLSISLLTDLHFPLDLPNILSFLCPFSVKLLKELHVCIIHILIWFLLFIVYKWLHITESRGYFSVLILLNAADHFPLLTRLCSDSETYHCPASPPHSSYLISSHISSSFPQVLNSVLP